MGRKLHLAVPTLVAFRWCHHVSNVACAAFHQPLHETYQEIATRSNELRQWPDSSSFRRNLRIDPDGKLVPPRFDNNDGPIGVFAMLDCNREAARILEACSGAFDSFCQRVQEEIANQDEWEQAHVLWTPKGTHHMCITMIQEHPTLLHTEEERKLWRPIDEKLEKKLVQELSEYQSKKCVKPVLRLDSLLWTPDGAMIAGFVEDAIDTTADSPFGRLKASSEKIAKRVLRTKQLTSRPKNLIHVTIGRFLGLSEDAPLQQSFALTELARHYNENVLPDLVASLQPATFTLDEVSLVRNVVWLLWEYVELGVWSPADHQDHCFVFY